VPASDAVVLRRFADPVPRRQLAMCWRTTTPHRDFLPQLAELIRDLPADLIRPLDPDRDQLGSD
jgi:LysR family transcriptional regulator, hydrogen peroxide-inducible genes activator